MTLDSSTFGYIIIYNKMKLFTMTVAVLYLL
jgi:hypothetical protein